MTAPARTAAALSALTLVLGCAASSATDPGTTRATNDVVTAPLQRTSDARAVAYARSACAEFDSATRHRAARVPADELNLQLARAAGYANLAATDGSWNRLANAIDSYVDKANMFSGAARILATSPAQVRALTGGPTGAAEVRAACAETHGR